MLLEKSSPNQDVYFALLENYLHRGNKQLVHAIKEIYIYLSGFLLSGFKGVNARFSIFQIIVLMIFQTLFYAILAY